MNTPKRTILYERLSRDDELQGPSNSIINQQNLLQEYAERNGFEPYVHVQDDGYSGTNWDRPGWQEIISHIDADEVSTLIVKDSSRIGRDQLRVGLYREMFREKGIRLIAVNEGLDSANGDDDFTPFRDLMAEWYARDTSKKIKAVAHAKGRSGKPLTTNVPYGYRKDPNDKNHWLIDPEAAAVVRRIFHMTLDGMGPFQIGQTLSAEKIERPSYYLGVRGIGNYKSRYSEKHKYAWSISTVSDLLAKPEYAGHTVNFRGKTENFKSKKKTKNPSDEWMVFENTHEAIIKQDVFDMVQTLRTTPRRMDKLGEANPLTGKLFCADCGAKLYNSRVVRTRQRVRDGETVAERLEVDCYQCSTHKLTKYTTGEECSLHHVGTTAVREIILDILQKTSGYIREHEDEFIERVRAKSAVRQDETAKSCQKQIAKNEKRIAELDKIFRSLYEDKALRRIDEQRFSEMTEGYDRERGELREKNAALQTGLDAFDADSIRVDKFIELARRYTSFDVLTTAMLNEFIDKVIVHEATWSEGVDPITKRNRGSRRQRIEVYLRYIGSFDVPDSRSPEEIEAERLRDEKLDRRRAANRKCKHRKNKPQRQIA